MKRIVQLGLGSQIVLIAVFLLATVTESGLRETQLAILTGLAITWTLILLATLIHVRSIWDSMSFPQQAVVTLLAAPGWTVGLPLIVLYFLGPSDDDWLPSD